MLDKFGDALGFLLVAGLLFLAPVWLIGYFLYETLNAFWHDVDLKGGKA